jgi:2TM domain
MEALDSTSQADAGGMPSEDTARDRTRKRLEARRDFGSHAVAFVVVNACVMTIWALTGAGYFWPVWVMAIWGVGLVLHAWEVFGRRPVTEADVDAEIRRQRSR